jgi:ABC-2 type transport system permease protein
VFHRLKPTAYLRIAQAQMLMALAHWADLLSEISLNALLLVGTAFIWTRAYPSDSLVVAGVGRDGMVTYAVLSVLLNAAFATTVQYTLHSRVRSGAVAADLVRPLNPIMAWLSEDIGIVFARLVTHIPPLALIALLAFKIAPPSSLTSALTFLASSVLSFVLVWTLSAAVALMTFWTGSLGNLGHLKDALVRFLSGALIPFWFLPRWLEDISEWLPFPLMLQTPLAIYIGRITPRDVWAALLLQAFWCGVLTLLVVGLWRTGRRRLLSQGG